MTDVSMERALILKSEILAIDRRAQERQQSALARAANRIQSALFDQKLRHQEIKADLSKASSAAGRRGLMAEAQLTRFRLNRLQKSKNVLTKASSELATVKAAHQRIGEKIAAIKTKKELVSKLHQKLVLKRNARAEERHAETIVEERLGAGRRDLFSPADTQADGPVVPFGDRQFNDAEFIGEAFGRNFAGSSDSGNPQSGLGYQPPASGGGGQPNHDFESSSKQGETIPNSTSASGSEATLTERIQAFAAYRGLAGEGVSFTYQGRSGDEVAVQLTAATDGRLNLLLSPSSERSQRELWAERGELLKSLKAAGVNVGDMRVIRGSQGSGSSRS